MKKFLLVFTAIFAMAFMASAQTTVTVGNGTESYFTIPYNSVWAYSFIETIYPDYDINMSEGTITEISYYLAESYSDMQTNNIKIYMKNVNKTIFNNNDDWVSVSNSDKVYEGEWIVPANYTGWVSIALDTPFVYDGTSNIMVGFYSANEAPGEKRYYRYTSLDYSYLSAWGTDDIDPTDPSTFGSHQRGNKRADIQFNFSSGSPTPIKTVFINGYTAPSWGAHPDADITVLAGAHYSISLAYWFGGVEMLPTDVFNQEDVPYFMHIDLTPEAGYEFDENLTAYFNGNSSIHDAIYNNLHGDGTISIYTIDYYLSPITTYDFDDGTMQGWTTIDADGDGHNWYHSSQAGNHGTGSGTSHSGEYHVNGESYCNNAGALHPDDYMVSPAKTQYSSISFWACAQDASYAAEHFGVAVSTAGNTDASDFTTIQEWTLTAKEFGNWYEYTVDLSAYAGQDIWVAIRHFDVSDQFIIVLDDITLSAIVGVTENNVNLFTMYPNPASDKVMIESEVNVNRYDIYNITGELVMSNEVDAETFTVNVENLPAGAYIIRLTSDGIIQNRRFIKE